ncbi:MAG: fasciclin domain-containing protein [Prevotellaceae bacterium]|nr:fasciclin domain-containing protein [Prevotellaceae bacterium]
MTFRKLTHSATLLVVAGAMSVPALESCTEDIDTSDRYTFTEETVASYLEKHESYSEYYALLSEVKISTRSESTVLQLLSARGNYTVFAPDNEAVQLYLDSLSAKGLISEPSWEGFRDEQTLDSIRKIIVYNSIIDGGDDTEAYQTGSFPGDTEEFMIANLNDRKLTMNYGTNPDSMFINGTKDDDGNVIGGSFIDLNNRDIPAINGYIHEVHTVIAPSNETLGDLLKSFIDLETEGFLVTAKVVMACGLGDTLSKIKDEAYEEAYLTGRLADLPTHPSYNKIGYLPEHRKYGFTIFAEPDGFWRETLGKAPSDITPEDVQQWVASKGLYPDATADDDYTNPQNTLYQFVTYHILPMRIPVDKLVIHYNEKGYYYATSTRYTVAVNETYSTFGQRRLFTLYQVGNLDGIYINRFPTLDNSRTGTYQELSCDADKQGFLVNTAEAQNVVNGYIYPIEAVNPQAGPATLAYTQETRENFLKRRWRFDVTGLFPEFMNNDIRANRVSTNRNLCVGLPVNTDYPYLEGLTISEGSLFYYLLGLACAWPNYQGDEFNVIGNYEMTFTLPPVPLAGTYEIRFGISNQSALRSMCQVYFGSDTDNLYAMGIPLDIRIRGADKLPGWADDTGDDDIDSETDKKMRNNGFMKGPLHYTATASSGSLRDNAYIHRHIIVREYMEPEKTYYLKFKSVLEDENKEFYMDYLEFCPKEVYDNPVTPEDAW